VVAHQLKSAMVVKQLPQPSSVAQQEGFRTHWLVAAQRVEPVGQMGVKQRLMAQS